MARLDEICTLNMGQSPSSSSYNETGDGLPFFQGNADFGPIHPTVRIWCNTPTKIAHPGDILISVRAPIGAMNIADKDCCIGRGLAAITVNEGLCSKEYVWYAIANKVDELNSKGTGSTFKAISKIMLGETEISLPSLEKQNHISCVLGKLSELISLRKQQLAKLDELVKVRFIEMFGELLLNTMAWDEYLLEAVCDKVVRYPTFYGMEYLPSGTRVIRIGNILPDGHMELNDKNYVFVYDTVNKDFPETVIELNDIIMAVRGDGSAAKRIGIVTEPKLIGANISPNLIRIKVNESILNPIYMFYYLTGEVGQKRLDTYVNKTAKKNIAAKDILKIVTPVPPLTLQNKFSSFITQTDKSKLTIQQSLDKLEMLKKALMQEYFR